MTDIEQRWTRKAYDLLVGRTIKRAEYLSKSNCEELGWDDSGLVLILDNGSQILVQCDDEGNGPGALVVQTKTDFDILPTIYSGHVS